MFQGDLVVLVVEEMEALLQVEELETLHQHRHHKVIMVDKEAAAASAAAAVVALVVVVLMEEHQVLEMVEMVVMGQHLLSPEYQ